ncbi:hypothetical protein Bpfe_029189 [Biomphalaria pfeifferi]|uniref:Uncharacterized protein n=1 Tax=Biomphalaria pfeifferi TaxID=112525 RepID=A0AAD8EVW6_BIOPF|nr:hypothetical protein Bpfe_029189 [Biomphalaria pfeifferi]
MCRTEELEDERHLFLRCPVVQAAKNTLERLLSGNVGVPVDVDKAITTNQMPAAKRKEADILGNIIVATYRQLVWMSRTKVWRKGEEKSAERMEVELRNMVDHHIQKIKR